MVSHCCHPVTMLRAVHQIHLSQHRWPPRIQRFRQRMRLGRVCSKPQHNISNRHNFPWPCRKLILYQPECTCKAAYSRPIPHLQTLSPLANQIPSIKHHSWDIYLSSPLYLCRRELLQKQPSHQHKRNTRNTKLAISDLPFAKLLPLTTMSSILLLDTTPRSALASRHSRLVHQRIQSHPLTQRRYSRPILNPVRLMRGPRHPNHSSTHYHDNIRPSNKI